MMKRLLLATGLVFAGCDSVAIEEEAVLETSPSEFLYGDWVHIEQYQEYLLDSLSHYTDTTGDSQYLSCEFGIVKKNHLEISEYYFGIGDSTHFRWAADDSVIYTKDTLYPYSVSGDTMRLYSEFGFGVYTKK